MKLTLTLAALLTSTPALAETVRTTIPISSETAHPGDKLTFTVDGDPTATAYGSVVSVTPKAKKMRSGSVTIQVRWIITGEDDRVAVSGFLTRTADVGVAKRVLVGGFGSMFFKGKDAVIEAGEGVEVTKE